MRNELARHWQRWERLQAVRHAMFVLGWILLILTPFVGILPGPGGVFVFAAGATLILRNSRWAKRHYARAKRRWPRPGAWADWGLRRGSAKRRAALKRESR